MVGMTVRATADVFAVGSAVLGLWAVARFPTRGPQSLRSALVVLAVVCVLLLSLGALTRLAVSAGGASFALLYVVLPILTLTFWSAGHLIRVGLGRPSSRRL
jgi:hypothetical protein